MRKLIKRVSHKLSGDLARLMRDERRERGREGKRRSPFCERKGGRGKGAGEDARERGMGRREEDGRRKGGRDLTGSERGKRNW